MSIAADTVEAEFAVTLRRDLSAERQANRALVEANNALRRQNERLRRLVRHLGTVTEAHSLKVQTMIREA